MRLKHWDVIKDGANVWAIHEVCPGYVYDPLISCLVNNPKELDGLCMSVERKTWGHQAMADELRSIVGSLGAEQPSQPKEKSYEL